MIRHLLPLVLALLLPALQAAAQSRVALVVGIATYQSPDLQPLPNAIADARAIDAKLRALGFASALLLDPTRDELQRGLADLFKRRRAASADTVLIYFAGHGVQSNGDGFLLARDSPVVPRNEMEEQQQVGLADLLRPTSEAKVAILLLDSCRNTPGLAHRLDIHSDNTLAAGLPRLTQASSQLVVSYSANPGARAIDGLPGHSNSPYAEALLSYLDRPTLELAVMLRGVSGYVQSITKGDQKPMFEDRRERDAAFYFQAGLAPAAPILSGLPQPEANNRIPAGEALALLTGKSGTARADALNRLLASPGVTTPLHAGDAVALLGDIPDEGGRRRRALSALLPLLSLPVDPAAGEDLLTGLSEISRRTALLDMRGCFARPMPDDKARDLVEGIPRADIPWIFRELTSPSTAAAHCGPT